MPARPSAPHASPLPGGRSRRVRFRPKSASKTRKHRDLTGRIAADDLRGSHGGSRQNDPADAAASQGTLGWNGERLRSDMRPLGRKEWWRVDAPRVSYPVGTLYPT